MTAPRTLLLVDGHSMLFRAWHGTSRLRVVDRHSGISLHGVYGMLSMLAPLLEQQPDAVAVCWDTPGETFRQRLDPTYKPKRVENNPEFGSQIEFTKVILDTIGVHSFHNPDFEGDDLLSTLAANCDVDGWRTTIVTSDRDLLQTATERTSVRLMKNGVRNMRQYTPQVVEAEFGVTPYHYPEMASLRGDPADQLRGVPGIGPKKAAQTLRLHGSLKALYRDLHDAEAAGTVVHRQQDVLLAHEGRVRRNLLLTLLITNVASLSGMTADRLVWQPSDPERVRVVFHHMFETVQLADRYLRILDTRRRRVA